MLFMGISKGLMSLNHTVKAGWGGENSGIKTIVQKHPFFSALLSL